jgi:hypothetical protein
MSQALWILAHIAYVHKLIHFTTCLVNSVTIIKKYLYISSVHLIKIKG